MQKRKKSENAFLHSLINQRANKDNAGKKALERFHFLTCLSNCFSACLSFALAFDNTHQNEKSEVNFRKKEERICQRARCQKPKMQSTSFAEGISHSIRPGQTRTSIKVINF